LEPGLEGSHECDTISTQAALQVHIFVHLQALGRRVQQQQQQQQKHKQS
jgi:hypothetical protein